MSNKNKNKNKRNNKNKKETLLSTTATIVTRNQTLAPLAPRRATTAKKPIIAPDSSSGMCTRAMEAGKRNLENLDDNPPAHDNTSSPSKKQAKTDNMDEEGRDILSNGSSQDHSKEDKSNSDRWAWLMNKLNSIENNTTSTNKDVASLTLTVEDHSKHLQETKSSLASHKRKIDELTNNQDTLLSRVDNAIGEQLESFKTELRKENEALKTALKKDNELFQAELMNKTNKKVEKAVSGAKEEAMESKTEARNRNLIIVGLPEGEDEEADLKAAKDLFTSRMGLSNINLDQIIRLGKQGDVPIRPALVTFQFLSHRNKVWYAKSKLKQDSDSDQGHKIWLQEDVPKPIKIAQKALYQTFRRAKSMKDTFKSVQLRGTKLIIDGEAYSHTDMGKLPTSLQPASLATRHSETVVIFFGRASPLSNHHHSPFLLEDHHFACVEQFLAWNRAKLTGNEQLSSKALSSPNPAVCKGILNELHHTNSAAWDEQLDRIIEAALTAKFTQNQDLGSFLVNTRPRKLGEASLNPKWGIGLKIIDKNAMDPAKWKEGGNLLGNKLMKIREKLFLKLHSN